MGLDVYLYKYSNYDEAVKLEAEYEKISDKNWEGIDWNNSTEEQRNAISRKNKEAAIKLGLTERGDYVGKQCIELDSTINSSHMFKIGYFRSSYNNSGVNSVLESLSVPTLYDIFQRPDEEYCFQPNWEEAKEKCKEAIALLTKASTIRCVGISDSFRSKPNSEKEAIDIFNEEKRKSNSPFENYSNSSGYFYTNGGMNVLAAIPGTQFGRDCTYLITGNADNQWYITALKIVLETIEFVLAQPDKDKYYFHWSA